MFKFSKCFLISRLVEALPKHLRYIAQIRSAPYRRQLVCYEVKCLVHGNEGT